MKARSAPAGVLEQDEFVFRRRDRSELHALLATSPILGEDGTYLGALAMVTDITRRVQAERAAQEAAGRIEQLANNLPGGVVYQDVLPRDGPDRFEWISAGVEQVLGVTPAEVLADPQSLLGRIHPDDVPEFRRRDEESTRSLSPFEMVMWFRGADEDYRWIHVRSMPRRRPEAMTSSSVVVSPGRSAPSPSPGCGGMWRVSVRRPATWTR